MPQQIGFDYSTYFLISPACWNAAASLMSWINSFQCHTFLAFLLCSLCLQVCAYALSFKLGFPSNAPLILTQCAVAIVDLSGQDDLDGDLRHLHFELLCVLVLAKNQTLFRMP